MSYSCPDCKEGELTVNARPVELKPGEEVHILQDGGAVITGIGCSNEECPSHGDAEEEEEEKKRPSQRKKKRTPKFPKEHGPDSDGRCLKTDECNRERGHTGRCNHELAGAAAE